MKFNILTNNNGVGIVTDAFILKDIIKKNISLDVEIKFINESIIENSDVGIWIQNYYLHLLEKFKINIFFINEEWFDYPIDDLKKFDYVVCKSKYTYNIFKNYCLAIYIPFVSKNFYDGSISKCTKFLHFVGRSMQKNTELVLKQNIPITLIDSYNRYNPNKKFVHVNTYQTHEQLNYLLNSHSVHICCSLYESWGHYLFEGLSTGAEIICSDIPVFKEQLDPNLVHFIPTREKIDDSYPYCLNNKNNLYKFRKAFFIDEIYLKNKLENFEPIGKLNERIKLFNQIYNTGFNSIKNLFNNL